MFSCADFKMSLWPWFCCSSTAILDIRIIHTSHDAQEIITRKATPSKMTKEIDEATKPTCTFPVKIIKAASKFQPASSGSGVNHLDLAHGAASSRRALSPGNSPSKFLDSGQGALGRRHRISRSVNRESSMPKFNEKGNLWNEIYCWEDRTQFILRIIIIARTEPDFDL